jgi:hypothetical protein
LWGRKVSWVRLTCTPIAIHADDDRLFGVIANKTDNGLGDDLIVQKINRAVSEVPQSPSIAE